MKLLKHVLTLSLLMPTILFASVQTDCDELRTSYQELQPQLPIQADLMTFMVGIEAYYSKSKRKCYSMMTATINMAAFIEAFVKMNNGITEKQLYEFLASKSGRNKFQETVKKKFNDKIKTNGFPSSRKGFIYKEIYSFSGIDYEKLILEHRY